MKAALLLGFVGLIAGCGFSSNSISIVGPAPPTLTSISVTPANLTLHAGATRQFIATGGYSDGSQQNITASVTWSSAAATVAAISNVAGSNGIATAVGAGSTTITAASGALSASTTLNVTSVTLVSIGVTPAAPTIAKGTAQQFTATGVYSDNTTQNLTPAVTWHAVNPAVASITTALGSGGLATGVGPGTTQITASLGGVIGSTNLTVTALVSISVTPATATIRVGAIQQFTATGHYSNLTTQDITASVTWNSGTMATATISNAAGSNGQATGLAQGTTLINAALGAINSNANPATLTVAAFAYAVNINKTNAPNANNLSQYIIGTNGTLIPMITPTVATGTNPYSLTTDPSRQFVYVANYDTTNVTTGSVSQFAIGADGSLTPLSTPSVAAGGGPNGIAANPTAPYVYVVNYNSHNVSQYSIGVGGLLTPLGTTPTVGTGPGPASIALTPAGTYAYVANNNYPGSSVGSVSQYSVDAAGTPTAGSLRPLSTPTVPAGGLPNGVVVDPSGRFVYVVNSNDNANGNSISQYTISQADGSLTAMSTPTVPTGRQPWSIALDAAGHNAYVPNRTDGTVTHYAIDATSGALTLAVPVAPATNPVAAGTGATSLAIDPSGGFAYVTNRDPLTPAPHTISQYSIAANGDLTPLAPPTATAGAQPAAIITSR
jgi:trimeric autotransporter adhesin